MRTEMSKICPNCFMAGYEQNACSLCGYVESPRVQGKIAPLPAGAILGNRYLVGRVLGEGGFGITYKVMDTGEGKICAVKEYAPLGIACRMPDMRTMSVINQNEISDYEEGVNKFLEEATVLHSLEGIPAVVRIMKSFLENGTAYFVMEYLDGCTLNRVLRLNNNKLPVENVTKIVSVIGLAMQTIHEKTKVLHRDISPENIYVLKDNTVKLIDFGSAKRLHNKENKGTRVFLKPNFAPPEQYDFKTPQGSYTDVYALASTYYYTLSGILLPSAPERQKPGKRYIPLKDMGLGVSAEISGAVDRALYLDASKRTQTMLAFVKDINPGTRKAFAARITPAKAKPASAKPASAKPASVKPASANSASAKPASVNPQKESAPYIVVAKGQNAGRKYMIKPEVVITMGRMSECDLCFDRQSEVSKIHCYLYFDKKEKCFFIEDKSSTNGTFMQGSRIKKNSLIKAAVGSRVSLGSNQCIVELGADTK